MQIKKLGTVLALGIMLSSPAMATKAQLDKAYSVMDSKCLEKFNNAVEEGVQPAKKWDNWLAKLVRPIQEGGSISSGMIYSLFDSSRSMTVTKYGWEVNEATGGKVFHYVTGWCDTSGGVSRSIGDIHWFGIEDDEQSKAEQRIVVMVSLHKLLRFKPY